MLFYLEFVIQELLPRLEALFHRQSDQFNSEIDQLKKQLRDSREDSKRKIDKLEQEIRQLNCLLHTDVPTAGDDQMIDYFNYQFIY